MMIRWPSPCSPRFLLRFLLAAFFTDDQTRDFSHYDARRVLRAREGIKHAGCSFINKARSVVYILCNFNPGAKTI